jgi:hypothetical protein
MFTAQPIFSYLAIEPCFQDQNKIQWPNFAIAMPRYLKYKILNKFSFLTFIEQAPKPAGYSKMSEFRAKGVSTSANRPDSLKIEDGRLNICGPPPADLSYLLLPQRH